MLFLAAVALAAAVAGAVRLARTLEAGAAYKAKILASARAVSGRELDGAAPEVSAEAYAVMRLIPEARSRAAVRPGWGACVAAGPVAALPPAPPRPAPRSWARAPENPALERVLARAFEEPGTKLRRTRAVLAVRDGAILGERYADGFSADQALCGWSMSKSALGALIGVAVGEGRLRLDDRTLLKEWSRPGDPRAAIALEDLLRMRSGLRFAEVYADPLSDVVQMLYARGDCGGFAASKPLAHPPGTLWRYASGTTNILSLILRRAYGADYHALPRRALFAPLGMSAAVFEADASGTFVGSSYLFASARDWASFGELHLDDGVRDGRRLLPEGWVARATTPTPQSPDGRYGMHWWLKVPADLGGNAGVPPDAYHALGHEGQCLTVIPSRRLVLVRLGLSISIDAWDHAAFVREALAAVDGR